MTDPPRLAPAPTAAGFAVLGCAATLGGAWFSITAALRGDALGPGRAHARQSARGLLRQGLGILSGSPWPAWRPAALPPWHGCAGGRLAALLLLAHTRGATRPLLARGR